jgi:hypothetical protein
VVKNTRTRAHHALRFKKHIKLSRVQSTNKSFGDLLLFFTALLSVSIYSFLFGVSLGFRSVKGKTSDDSSM